MSEETVEQRDARLGVESTEAALCIELAGLEKRSDPTGKRRAAEVREQLAELTGEKPAEKRTGRQSRPRVAAETRGE
jgi:hypothetical protein